MRASVVAALAVALVAGCSTGGVVDDDSGDDAPPTRAEWPVEVAAAWVGVPSGKTGVVPAPLADPALVVVGADGVVEWHGAVNARPVAIASGPRVALVREGDESEIPTWTVWDLRTDDVVALSCAEGTPVLEELLEPHADEFIVLGGCGDGRTVASVDAETGELVPGEAAPHDDASMWVPGSRGFVTVEGAPGPCRASGPAVESTVAVTCDDGDSLFRIGWVDVSADGASGTYRPDDESGDYPQFFQSTAFTHLGRHWVNTNTVEGTPLLASALSENEQWMTALAPLGDQVFMARGLDPYGPSVGDGPALGVYDPGSGVFAELDLPEGTGVAHWALGVPVG